MSRVPATVYAATHQAPVALALAALREAMPAKAMPAKAGVVRDPQAGAKHSITIGPLMIGREVQRGAAVELLVLRGSHDAEPLHPALAGRATEVLTGTYLRAFPIRALLEALRPLTQQGPARLWLAADAPRWRIAWPLVVIPDAQAMLPGL